MYLQGVLYVISRDRHDALHPVDIICLFLPNKIPEPSRIKVKNRRGGEEKRRGGEENREG